MLIFLLASSLLLLISTTTALTLTDFQPINGFSSQCTQAYNTPLQGCTQSDFQSGHSCSTGCITFLEALTKMLNTDCKGTSAFPNTLIGLFFSQQGTSTLCPNVLGSSGGEGGDQSLYSSAASPNEPSTSAGNAQTSNSAIPTTSSPAPSSTSLPSSPAPLSTSSQSSAPSASASSTTVVIQTTVQPTDTAGNSLPMSSTANASKTSSASGASNTANKAGSGGGTILELGSTSNALPCVQGSPWWMLLGFMSILVWPQ